MSRRQILILLIILLALIGISVLFFYGGPNRHAPRSLKELWNLGHVFYFAALTLFVFRLLNYFKVPYERIWVISILLTLIWGLSIEMIQQGGQRSFSLVDLARDICGTLVALVLIRDTMTVIPQRLQSLLRYLVLGFSLIILFPFVVALTDEIIAVKQFPVLSNFEAPFEADRWQGSTEFKIIKSVEGSSGPVMQITLHTDVTYPGVSMQYLVSDWSEYDDLFVDIYYPHKNSLRLSLKVFDLRHQTVKPTYQWHDRYNGSYELKQGWNRIRVPLQDIRNAPKNREMDLTEIAGVQLFGHRLQQPRTIYLDRIYLGY